jgi:hypothetical protein
MKHTVTLTSALLLMLLIVATAHAQSGDPGDDPTYFSQLGLDRAWTAIAQLKADGVVPKRGVIVVADGRVKCDIPDLVGRCLEQYHQVFTSDGSSLAPDHATLTSALMVAVHNNNAGIKGISPDDTLQIVNLEIINKDGVPETEAQMKAYEYTINWLVDHEKLNVYAYVTASNPDVPSFTEKYIPQLQARGIMYFPASMSAVTPLNLDDQKTVYPPNFSPTYPNVIPVAGTKADAMTWDGVSNYGPSTVMGAMRAENLNTVSLIPPYTGVGRAGNVSISGFQAAAIYGLYRAWLEPDPWVARQLLFDTAEMPPGLQGRVKYGRFTAKAFGPPTPCPAPGAGPVLVTWWSSPTAIALDSVTLRSRPFTLSLPQPYNFDPVERRAQVSVFLKLGADPNAGAVSAVWLDASNTAHPLAATYGQHVPGTDCLHQVNVRLEPDMPQSGMVRLKVAVGGVFSNEASIEISGP